MFKKHPEGGTMPACMEYMLEADENPFRTGAKDELW